MNIKTVWRAWLLPSHFSEPEVDPRPVNASDDTSKADSAAYVTMESLAALEAFAPGLLENQCASVHAQG